MKKSLILVLVLLLVLSLTGCGKDKHDKSYVDDKTTYTMRYAVNSMPTSWNNHTYQSNDATNVIDNTEDSLYVFDYNETKDGYKIVPSMATEMPKDVTKDYVGKYGITEESENQVYEITLKDWLKFDNGDPITANDFIESAKRLMNPQAANYRADNFYSGNLKIYNAKEYAYSGMTVINENATNDFYTINDLTKGADGVYTTPDGNTVYVAVDWALSEWLSGNTLSDYVGAYGDSYFDVSDWDKLVARMDADENSDHYGLAPLTDDTYKYLLTTMTGNPAWGESEDDAPNYLAYDYSYPEVDWSDVGYFAKDDHTLVLALTKPLTGFYLNYALCSNMNLVHIPTYDKCTSVTDGVYSNSYGTSVDTYVGYGPYKLTDFLADSNMAFARNEFWHGYFEEEHKGQYQTTNITYKQVSEASTRLEMFLKGELESYGLQRDDMDDYQGSDFTYFTEGDSTWFIALNPNESALANAEATASPVTAGNTVVKRIICIKEFRQALSFAVDRAAYELALDPTGAPAKALYGNMIISDPDTGTAYRTTDEAKQVIVNFWGLADSYGEGKEYADIDAAIDSISGYDLAGAKELFNQAYDKAVEAGYIPANSDAWEIQIIIGQPGSGSSAYYNNGYHLLKQVWTEAVKGTKLEGHIEFTQSQPLGSSSFSSYLKNNSIDLLFGVGWTGSALDPYGLIQAYVQESYQYDPAIDYTSIQTEVEIDGVKYTAATYDWYLALSGETITAKAADGSEKEITAGTTAENSLRLAVLAAIEGTVLQQYTMIPVGLDASATLKCMRVNYYTEEYVFGMGRGGLQYITFAMDDAEWANYVKEHGGTLDYK